MLQHLNQTQTAPQRVVLLCANGFVGHAIKQRLLQDNIPLLALTRDTMNLLADDAVKMLADALQPTDALVVIAAQAPCKNRDMLMNNLQMMQTVCTALEKQPVQHVLYISSDAVYSDSSEPLTETSITAPDNFHGMMHCVRELMLRETVGETPLAVLRPSLLYGANDPHNGYGPNQFRRRAQKSEAIDLFGEGEERRDHVFIDDVAEITYRCLMHRSQGILNIATGEVASFRDIAEQVNALSATPVAINTHPRKGPMPHNGYRPFDRSACQKAFPDFRYTSLQKGLAMSHEAEQLKVTA